MATRRAPRVAAVLAVVWSLLLLLPAPAGAHAYLVRTDPGDGTTLQRAPHEITLSFSEHVVLDATRIEIVDGDGKTVKVTDLKLATEDAEDTEVPSAIIATLPDLPVNSYHVAWETLSSDDLHITSGFFVFGVGRAVAPSEFVEPVPRFEESALRWLLLLGVCFALGSALLEPTLRGRPELAAGRARLRGLAWVGSLAALLTSVVLLLNQITPSGLTLTRLLDSGYGARWGWRETGLLMLAASSLLALRGFAPRWRRGLLVSGAVLTATGTAALGHSGAAAGTTRLVATAAHILAVTTWAGGVLCLVVLVASAFRADGPPVPALRAVLRAFALPAAACVSVVVVTGIYLSSAVVASVDALLATTYGRTLLVKVGVVALMGLVGLVNHRRVRGRHDLDVPRRTVTAEALLGVLALAASGVLASGQPATEPEFLQTPAATRGPLAAQVGDLQEAVNIRPNVPGRNLVTVDVFDARRPSPGPVTGVELALAGATVPATSTGDGHWTAPLDDVRSGPAQVTVIVHRAGLPETTWREDWVVGDSHPARQPVVSMAPVSGLLRWTAAGLAAVLACTWGWFLLRRWRRRTVRPSAPSLPPEDEPAGVTAGGPGAPSHEPRLNERR